MREEEANNTNDGAKGKQPEDNNTGRCKPRKKAKEGKR